jgi:8-oxo-dGTP diphosphatase
VVDFTKVEIVKYTELDTKQIWNQETKIGYDHEEIIHYANQRLKWKLEYTNIAKDILASNFRLSQLQSVYETILCKELDKRNFLKKIMKLWIIKETWKLDRSTNRPAKLYQFVDIELKNYEVI